MNDSLTILCGDCVEQIRTLPDASVHCCVTSPPYDDLRDYNGHNKWDFGGVALELFRVLAPGGIVCWNIADQVVRGSETLTGFRQAIYFVDAAGFRMHARQIYHKTNFSNPSRNRYHRMFEDVFILSKGAPRTFNPIKDKRNIWAGSGTFGKNTIRERDGSMSERKRNVITAFGMRGNVWTGKTRGQEEMCNALPRPSMMPKWLARDLILSWSNPADTVLDPFGGSGTTGKMALLHGRRVILIDKDPAAVPVMQSECDITPGLDLFAITAPTPPIADCVSNGRFRPCKTHSKPSISNTSG